MTNVHEVGTAAQLPPPTANGVADFDDAIRNARVALFNGPLDSAIVGLTEAGRLAAEVNNPHAHELANLARALDPALETLKLVEMCLHDMFPEQ